MLDLAVRAFDEVCTFTFVLMRGLDCSRPVLEYPARRYGLAPSVELLHPAVGEYLREGWYSDTSERTDAIPTYSMIQAYDHARLSLGADVVCDGNKDADGVWRRRLLLKPVYNQSWYLPLVRRWSTYDVLGYLAAHKLTSPMPADVAGRTQAFNVGLSPAALLWLWDTYPSDFASVEALFPHVRAVVKRRDFFGEIDARFG